MSDSKNDSTRRAEDASMEKMELFIGRLLMAGVAVSMAVISAGVMLMFIHHPDYLKSAADLRRLIEPGAAFPHTLGQVAQGLMAGRGQAVVALGLMLLIATPIFRVVAAMVGFALQRDRGFTLISTVVLIVLLISFALGKAG